MDHRVGREPSRGGRLPTRPCLVAWYGVGRGQVCAVCLARIRGSEAAVECEGAEGPGTWFHVPCYTVWRTALAA